MPYSPGFDYKSFKLIDLTATQSPDIAQAVHVDKAEDELGAGDQVSIISRATATGFLGGGNAKGPYNLLPKGIYVWLCER